MKGAIASPHWEACETCVWSRNGGKGCDQEGTMSLSLHPLGDWIICDEYEEKEQPDDD